MTNKRVGYKAQGKSRAANQKPVQGVKPGFAINQHDGCGSSYGGT